MRTATLLLVAVLTLSACSRDDALRQADDQQTPAPSEESSGVPEEFRSACGKPGAEVVTERLEVRIPRSECDLTGVTIVNQGRGAVVPEPGSGVANSSGIDIEVDRATGDVVFRAEAEVPQY